MKKHFRWWSQWQLLATVTSFQKPLSARWLFILKDFMHKLHISSSNINYCTSGVSDVFHMSFLGLVGWKHLWTNISIDMITKWNNIFVLSSLLGACAPSAGCWSCPSPSPSSPATLSSSTRTWWEKCRKRYFSNFCCQAKKNKLLKRRATLKVAKEEEERVRRYFINKRFHGKKVKKQKREKS